MCSRKWATPFVFSSSYTDPASTNTPTVAVSPPVSSISLHQRDFEPGNDPKRIKDSPKKSIRYTIKEIRETLSFV
jgi:hypothetical protein